MFKKYIGASLLVAAFTLAGCTVGTNTTADGKTNTPAPSNEPIDSCALVNATDVKTALGWDVVTRTTVIGSCNLTSDTGDSVLLQTVAVNLYNQSQYPNSTTVSIGEKAFVQTPDSQGYSVSQAYKDGKTFILTLRSSNTYTNAQIEALLRVIVGRG